MKQRCSLRDHRKLYSDTHILGSEGSPTIYAAFTLAKAGRKWQWPAWKYAGWMYAGSSDLAGTGRTIEDWWNGPEETRPEIRKWLRNFLIDLKEQGIITAFKIGDTSAGVPLGPITDSLSDCRSKCRR